MNASEYIATVGQKITKVWSEWLCIKLPRPLNQCFSSALVDVRFYSLAIALDLHVPCAKYL